MRVALRWFQNNFITSQFVTFGLVGVINTLSSSVIASVCSSFIGYKIAFVLGYIAGIVISYFLNTCVTFRKKPTLKTFIYFPLTTVPNFVIQYLSLLILVEGIGISEKISYFVAAIIGVPITFICTSLLFKTNHSR